MFVFVQATHVINSLVKMVLVYKELVAVIGVYALITMKATIVKYILDQVSET